MGHPGNAGDMIPVLKMFSGEDTSRTVLHRVESVASAIREQRG